MDLTGEHRINAPRAVVWAGLNDPETLKQSIDAVEEITKVSDSEFDALAVVKVGPVKAKFKGKITLSDIDPPNGYTIAGEGQGGAAGFAKGSAKVNLEEADGGSKGLPPVAWIGGLIVVIGAGLWWFLRR
jgi:carbon monoxide dehydrogenase subunit G